MEPCKLLIFVVDDEMSIVSTLVTILEHEGYDVMPFTNPLAALEAANFQAPDLLITDVVMTPLDGVEFAIRVKERHPNCKVLLLSGNPATSELCEGARAKGLDFTLLPKPTHPTVLLKQIHSLIGVNPAEQLQD